MDEKAQKDIETLQLIEQNLQTLLMQRQQFQLQLVEIDSALKELEKVDKAYKIISNIMVSASKEELLKELKEKKDIIELRIKSIEKQEKDLKERANKLQKQILSRK